MKILLSAGFSAMIVAAPLGAQTMDHSTMPGMTMPTQKTAAKPSPARNASSEHTAAPPSDTHPGHAMPDIETDEAQALDPHAGHEMSGGHDMTMPPAMATDEHAGHEMSTKPEKTMPVGTDLKPGNAPAPPPSPQIAASRYYGDVAMRDADRAMRREHGGMTYSQVLFNLAEYQVRDDRDGYRWDGEAWFGGDINRAVLKSEGEGTFGEPLEAAEVQALYSRALDPYWNLQAGIRYDFKPNASRTYATVGIEGLAPYWFDVEGAMFLSDKGHVFARAGAWYDARLTQFLVLQPRMEANFAAQTAPPEGIGSGLTDIDLGLRLRYDKVRELAPYVGISWERQFGETARLTRARGDDTGGLSFVVGMRSWF